MAISELTKTDINKVAHLLRDYWKTRNMGYSLAWAKKYLIEGHKNEIKKELSFVLKEDKELIGYLAIIIWEGNLVELRDFVIKQRYRNKEHGKNLLEYALSYCKKHNLRKVFTLTFSQHRKFYEQFGFIEEGHLKDHFIDGEDLILMSKKLEREKQINLKARLEHLDIEEKTSEHLQKLPTK